MTKFNRRFNTQLKSFERWYNIFMRLSEFEGLINSYDGASPEEVQVMKVIHKKLYECNVMAKGYLNEAVKIGHVRDIGRR